LTAAPGPATVPEEPIDDPIARFTALFSVAAERETADPTAAALGTADAGGRPSVRMVLVKGVDDAGFRFYTNLGSRKARELAANPHAALCFHWPALGRQVRVEGGVAPLPSAESDAYFASRPRDSQFGAWASRQSAPLAAPGELEERLRRVRERHSDGLVPRPPFWGGYLLAPERIEFWNAGEYRLHVRELYSRDAQGWRRERLYP
jgi:pyridoxamine 5'-phosphate oxidase